MGFIEIVWLSLSSRRIGVLGFCFGDGIWSHIAGFGDFGIGEVGGTFWLEVEQTLVLNFERKKLGFCGLNFQGTQSFRFVHLYGLCALRDAAGAVAAAAFTDQSL